MDCLQNFEKYHTTLYFMVISLSGEFRYFAAFLSLVAESFLQTQKLFLTYSLGTSHAL
jgi:hypothetical protein